VDAAQDPHRVAGALGEQDHLIRLDQLRGEESAGASLRIGAEPAVDAIPVVLAQQRQATGGPSPRQPFPLWMTCVLAALATIIVAAAIALFLQPEETADLWPWALPPLAGRVIGSWMAGIGTAAALAALESCWRRFYPVAAWFAAAGLLELLAVALHSDDVEWGDPYGWVYVAVVAVVTAVGALGLAVVHLGVSPGQRAPKTAASSSGTGRSSWS